MSHVDRIIGELRAMAVGVGRAQANAAAADSRAQDVAAQAARSGFTGVAAGMSRVREAIGWIRARLATLEGAITEAATVTTAAPREMSPEQALAVLSLAREKVRAAHQVTAAAITQVNETCHLVAAVLRGGQPGPMLATLTGVKEMLVLVARHGGVASQYLGTAIGQARQVGALGN